MANNTFNATAANILSSLGIKGATELGGIGKDGKVPVLGPNGLLDISLLPISDLVLSLDIQALQNTAYVDPRYTGTKRNGSIVTPFNTLDEAAAYSSDGKTFANFILVGDAAVKYNDATPVFATRETTIRIFSTGTSTFNNLALYWNIPATQFILSNVSVNSYLKFQASLTCSIDILGSGSIGTLQGATDSSTGILQTLTDVRIDPGITIGTLQNVKSFGYLTSGSRIANGSTVVAGATITDATDSLGKRRLRVPTFTNDSTGIHVSELTDIEVSSDSSDDYDLYDLSDLGTTLATSANATFYKENDSPVFADVLVSSVSATTISATDVSAAKLILSGLPVYISADDFLVVGDGEVITSYYKTGGDLYFKSYISNGVQHYVKQTIAKDSQIGWGANWTGDYILVDGVFINVETGASDGTASGDVEEFYRVGEDLYFKSHIVSGVQHYVKQSMSYDSQIGWGADWVGDYILFNGKFIDVSSSDSSDSSDSSSD